MWLSLSHFSSVTEDIQPLNQALILALLPWCWLLLTQSIFKSLHPSWGSSRASQAVTDGEIGGFRWGTNKRRGRFWSAGVKKKKKLKCFHNSFKIHIRVRLCRKRGIIGFIWAGCKHQSCVAGNLNLLFNDSFPQEFLREFKCHVVSQSRQTYADCSAWHSLDLYLRAPCCLLLLLQSHKSEKFLDVRLPL